MKVKILKKSIDIQATGFLPTKGTKYSAGLDVYSPIKFMLSQGETKRVKLGIAIEISENEVAIMSERSSMSILGITSIGNVIDSDYRGEISIVLQNNGSQSKAFNVGDKIGQILILKLGDNEVNEVFELSDSNRNENGFGSTGP